MLDFYYVESDPAASGLKKPEFGRQNLMSYPSLHSAWMTLLGEEQISFLKIDVEGAELEALCGAYRLLRRNQPLILCELMESYHQRFGRSVSDLIGYLNDLGYRGFEVNIGPRSSAQLCVQPLQPEKLIHNPKITLNGLFIPASQVEHRASTFGWCVSDNGECLTMHPLRLIFTAPRINPGFMTTDIRLLSEWTEVIPLDVSGMRRLSALYLLHAPARCPDPPAR